MLRYNIILKVVFLVISINLLVSGCNEKVPIPVTISKLDVEWKAQETEQFNIYYTRSEEDVLLYMNGLSDICSEVSDKFFQYIEGEVAVNIVVLSDEMLNELGISNQSGAGYNGDVIILNEDKLKDISVLDTIRHELIHVFTDSENFNIDNTTPGWFKEGIAQYYQFNIHNNHLDSFYIDTLETAYREDALINFSRMDISSGDWNGFEIPLAYSQSTAMYYYLINRYEEEDIIRIFYTNGDFYDNLYSITGEEFEDVEYSWKKFIVTFME